jgi:hypothetical protein
MIIIQRPRIRGNKPLADYHGLPWNCMCLSIRFFADHSFKLSRYVNFEWVS